MQARLDLRGGCWYAALTGRGITEALQAKIGTLSLEAQTKLEKDTAKKEAKAEAKAETALKKKMVRVLPSPGSIS